MHIAGISGIQWKYWTKPIVARNRSIGANHSTTNFSLFIAAKTNPAVPSVSRTESISNRYAAITGSPPLALPACHSTSFIHESN